MQGVQAHFQSWEAVHNINWYIKNKGRRYIIATMVNHTPESYRIGVNGVGLTPASGQSGRMINSPASIRSLNSRSTITSISDVKSSILQIQNAFKGIASFDFDGAVQFEVAQCTNKHEQNVNNLNAEIEELQAKIEDLQFQIEALKAEKEAFETNFRVVRDDVIALLQRTDLE